MAALSPHSESGGQTQPQTPLFTFRCEHGPELTVGRDTAGYNNSLASGMLLGQEQLFAEDGCHGMSETSSQILPADFLPPLGSVMYQVDDIGLESRKAQVKFAAVHLGVGELIGMDIALSADLVHIHAAGIGEADGPCHLVKTFAGSIVPGAPMTWKWV